MTCSAIVVWFALRCRTQTRKRIVLNMLGPVNPQLDHLVQLGILRCHDDFQVQDKMYSLRRWRIYQEAA